MITAHGKDGTIVELPQNVCPSGYQVVRPGCGYE
jgi:hypothetical protein